MVKKTKAFLKKPRNAEMQANKHVDDISQLDGFKSIRDILYDIEKQIEVDKGAEEKYLDAFNAIREFARRGNEVAQDYIGYAYKKGMGYLIPENFELSMKWLFLAGSNKNEQSIKRLKLFFSRSYDEILSLENAPEILANHEIYIENYEFELGKLFCDALVDELGITAEKLFNEPSKLIPSTIELANKYEKLREKSLLRVVDYLFKK